MSSNVPNSGGRGFRLGDDDPGSTGESGSRSGGGNFWSDTADTYDHPDYWEGTLSRRIFAYLIDFCILGLIGFALWIVLILSFGVLLPVITVAWALTPLAYHTLMVSQYGATIGQRAMKLEIRDPETGEKPHVLQALVLTILFYGSITTLAFVPLLYCFFDDRNRLLHDLLTRTRTIRVDR